MKVKNVWREIVDFLKMIRVGNPNVIFILILGSMAKAGIPFLSLYYSAKILNQIIAAQYEKCVQSVVILLLAQLVLGIIEKLCFQTITILRVKCEKSVNQRIAAKAYELEYEEFEKQETMDAIRRTRLTAMGSGGIQDQVLVLYHFMESIFATIYSLVFMIILLSKVSVGNRNFFTSYWSTIVLVIIYGGIILFSNKMQKRIQNAYEEMSKKNDRNNSIGTYMFGLLNDEKNAKDIRVFQMQDMMKEKKEVFHNQGLGIYLETGKKVGKFSGINGFAGQMAAACAYLFVGAKAFYGVIGIGDVLLYAGAINRAVSNILGFLKYAGDFCWRASYLKSLDEFIARPSMSYDGTLPIEKRDDGNYEFEFHDVSFAYPGTEQKVLNHISLKFNIGESMAIVGRNGAGKSTIIKLLCRLYEPAEGYITLNGIDIRKYNYQEYTQAFSVVFQDFHIFSLPLDENVASGEEIEEEKVWKVLEEVGLKDRVEHMEDGIHTHLYNNNGEGVDLSGGEAQRLAIARALYKDAPFVILDEPTAALDPIAEAEIYENFNRMIENKTAIYISHRMSSCKFCDNIVVLDKGEIAERGKHDQLLEQQGIYAELYETQAQYYA